MAFVLGDTLLDASTIQARVAALAADIDTTYRDAERPLILLAVLKGSVFFATDLGRAVSVPVEFEFIAVRSYGAGTKSSGSVELVKDVSMVLRDRDVLMVEDIIDTGLTTSYLFEHLGRHQPRSLRLVSLLSKPDRREREVHIDFCGFEIPNEFVVGYGLDLGERYRNLPDVRLMREVDDASDTAAEVAPLAAAKPI